MAKPWSTLSQRHSLQGVSLMGSGFMARARHKSHRGAHRPMKKDSPALWGKQYAKYIQLLLAKGCSMAAEKHTLPHYLFGYIATQALRLKGSILSRHFYSTLAIFPATR